MDTFWQSVVPPFSPLLFGALIYAEAVAFCAAQRWRLAQLSIGLVTFSGLVILQYATQPSSYALQTRPFAYFLVIIWVTFVPVAVLSVGAHLLGRADAPILRHVGLAALAVTVIAALPLFALWSLCASGLDCV